MTARPPSFTHIGPVTCQLDRIVELAKEDYRASRPIIEALLDTLVAIERASGIRVYVEFQSTRDTIIDEPPNGWSCVPVFPPGDDWHVFDAGSGHKTKFRRFRLVRNVPFVEGSAVR
jgi:hypothetical protein